MDALINHVKHEAGSLDDVGRQKIIDGLRHLALSIETPEDSIQRINYLVRSHVKCHGALITSSIAEIKLRLSSTSKLPSFAWELISSFLICWLNVMTL